MPKDPLPLDRETLVTRLRDLAARLGKTAVTRYEFCRELGIAAGKLKRFGSFLDLARDAGLRPHPGTKALSDEELLTALRDDIVRLKGKISLPEFRQSGRYNIATYRKHWGSWPGSLAALARWLDWREPNFPHLAALRSAIGKTAPTAAKRPLPSGRPCGPPLNFRDLRHAPLNEQGVVFLFGALASRLGFVVENIANGFPDCTAKRRIDRPGDFWATVRIEFEHESRNFKAHGHDPEGCDLIVCWEHNWPECPLEVIELKSAVAAGAA